LSLTSQEKICQWVDKVIKVDAEKDYFYLF